jgi:hypothetical protein
MSLDLAKITYCGTIYPKLIQDSNNFKKILQAKMSIFIQPSLEHQLLLQASLCQGEKAITAWQKWITSVDIENLDDSSYYLLPLLYRNLVAQQENHAEMTRLKGVYRRNWYNNQLQITKAKNIFQSFTENNIKFLVIRNLALSTCYYSDLGVRPIRTLDIFISPKNLPLAINLLKDLGWQARTNLTGNLLSLYPKIGFWDDSNSFLHLHWRLFFESHLEDDFFYSPVKAQIAEIPVSLLNPEQELLDIFWQLTANEPNYSVSYLADAYQIIQLNYNHIQWQDLIDKAQKYGVVYQFKSLLVSLENIFSFSLDNTINFDQVQYHNSVEKIEMSLDRIKFLPIYSSLNQKITAYLRLANRQQFPLTLAGFLEYLKTTWNLNNSYQIPEQVIKRLWQRINKHLNVL